MTISEYRHFKRVIKIEQDPEMKAILIDQVKEFKQKVKTLIVNLLAILLIITGFVFNSSMPLWIVECHGGLVAIFLLGTWIYVRDKLNKKYAAGR